MKYILRFEHWFRRRQLAKVIAYTPPSYQGQVERAIKIKWLTAEIKELEWFLNQEES